MSGNLVERLRTGPMEFDEALHNEAADALEAAEAEARKLQKVLKRIRSEARWHSGGNSYIISRDVYQDVYKAIVGQALTETKDSTDD